jgi:PAS domain S-box-containing protein
VRTERRHARGTAHSRHPDHQQRSAPYTSELALEYIHRAAAGEPQRFEWCSTHPFSGAEIWVEVGLQKVGIDAHDRLLAVVRDISERKLAERALRESEEAYRAIFQHSSEAIWVHDVATLAMLDVNQAGCDMYGYTRDEMLAGGLAPLLYPDSEYTAERALGYLQRTVAGSSRASNGEAATATARKPGARSRCGA